MAFGLSPVVVMQLPEQVDAQVEQLFLRDLNDRMDASRPRIVLDCSPLLQLDRPTVHLLLGCLEGAMKRNGDVKLATLSDEAHLVFPQSGLEGLFEIFDTVSEAVDSYERSPLKQFTQKNAAADVRGAAAS